MSDRSTVRAPWTAEQVDIINRWQAAGVMHPYTCGETHINEPGDMVLIAGVDGWHCPDPSCGYRQGWVAEFMLDEELLAAIQHNRNLVGWVPPSDDTRA